MKYRDDKRYTLDCTLIGAGLVVGISIILSYFLRAKIIVLARIIACIVILLCGLVWLLENQAFKFGLKRAWQGSQLVRAIEDQLIDAKIFIERYKTENGVIGVDLPRILVDWNDEPVIKIANSIKFHQKFSDLDFSAGVLNYTVEDSYFSFDENWLILELHDFTKSRRLVFDSFENFKNEIENVSKNQLLIDQNLTINNQHCLIVGRTGSGKSYFLETLIAEWLIHGVDLSIADPKNADLSVISEKINGKSATTFDQISKLISDFCNEMKNRMVLVRKKLRSDPNKTAFDFGLTERVLIIDEFGAFSAQLQRQKKADRDKIMGQLQEIIFMGRQLGCYLVLILQKTDATTIPTSIRDNMGFRIVLGQNDATTYQTTFGTSSDVPKIKMKSGKGWYTVDGGNLMPKLAETPTINFNLERIFTYAINRQCK